VRDAMLQSFYALRECFLEELDLDEPSNPLLIHSGRRTKRPGSSSASRSMQARQSVERRKMPDNNLDVDALLSALYEKEQAKT
jgi:hypothetical protein